MTTNSSLNALIAAAELPSGHPGRRFDDTPEYFDPSPLLDQNSYRGHCLHCRREITAQGGVEWRRAVRRPCPHCGRPTGNEHQGLETGFEQKAGRKRLDVFAHVDSLQVIFESLRSCPRDSPPH